MTLPETARQRSEFESVGLAIVDPARRERGGANATVASRIGPASATATRRAATGRDALQPHALGE